MATANGIEGVQRQMTWKQEREVYEALWVKGNSRVDLMVNFRLSDDQLDATLAHAETWQAEQVLATPERPPHERRRIAEHLYRQQQLYFYQEAMSAWRLSQGEREETRSQRDDYGLTRPLTIRRNSHGSRGYLKTALEIIQAMIRLDGGDPSGKVLQQLMLQSSKPNCRLSLRESTPFRGAKGDYRGTTEPIPAAEGFRSAELAPELQSEPEIGDQKCDQSVITVANDQESDQGWTGESPRSAEVVPQVRSEHEKSDQNRQESVNAPAEGPASDDHGANMGERREFSPTVNSRPPIFSAAEVAAEPHLALLNAPISGLRAETNDMIYEFLSDWNRAGRPNLRST